MSRAVLILTVLLMVGCSAATEVDQGAPPLPDSDPERVVYVSLGGNETLSRQLDEPLRDAWTQQLFMSALPRSAVHVNFALRDATVRNGVVEQLPRAMELQPTIATLWFGSADDVQGTGQVVFERDLSQMVADLVAAGAEVLLMSPGDSSTVDGARFATAIDRVATSTGVRVVDVPTGDLGDPATHEAVAEAVARALEP